MEKHMLPWCIDRSSWNVKVLLCSYEIIYLFIFIEGEK